MIEKFKLALNNLIPAGSKVKGHSLMIFKALIYVIGLVVLMYLFGCVQLWLQTGKAPLPELKALAEVLTSPSACVAFTAYAASLIDKDGDGESDMAVNKAIGGDVHEQRRSR